MYELRALTLAFCLLCTCLNCAAESLRFVVFGDMPYRTADLDAPGHTDTQTLMRVLLPNLAKRKDIAFVVHLGDTGLASDACHRAWLRRQSVVWKKWIRPPLFYTPGDNDWADCEAPRERLEDVRRTLVPQPRPIETDWRLERQRDGNAVENAIWWIDGRLFVAVHSVTPYGGEMSADLRDVDTDSRGWLTQAFNKARSDDTRAMVVFTHADWFDRNPNPTLRQTGCDPNHVHAALCGQFEKQAKELRKPVLLVHGDSNAYCFDRPFGEEVSHIWRLNAPGDFNFIDMAEVTASVVSPDRPFGAASLRFGDRTPAQCDYRRRNRS